MSIDDQVTKALTRITAAVQVGDASKVRAVLRDLLETRLETEEQTEHQRRLETLAGDSLALARYAGELGLAARDAEALIGHVPTGEEKAAMEQGASSRRTAVRAIELQTVTRGGKLAVPEWMRR